VVSSNLKLSSELIKVVDFDFKNSNSGLEFSELNFHFQSNFEVSVLLSNSPCLSKSEHFVDSASEFLSPEFNSDSQSLVSGSEDLLSDDMDLSSNDSPFLLEDSDLPV